MRELTIRRSKEPDEGSGTLPPPHGEFVQVMLTGRRDPTDRIVITGFFSVPNKHDFGRHRYYLLELKTRGRSLHFVVAVCFGFGTGHEVVQKGRAEQWFGTLGSPVG